MKPRIQRLGGVRAIGEHGRDRLVLADSLGVPFVRRATHVLAL